MEKWPMKRRNFVRFTMVGLLIQQTAFLNGNLALAKNQKQKKGAAILAQLSPDERSLVLKRAKLLKEKKPNVYRFLLKLVKKNPKILKLVIENLDYYFTLPKKAQRFMRRLFKKFSSLSPANQNRMKQLWESYKVTHGKKERQEIVRELRRLMR